MIFDKMERAKRYYFLNENFKKAFDYIKENDLMSFEPGIYNIDGENSYLIIAHNKPDSDFISKLESHRKYIDVQIAVEGSFGLTWKALEDCRKLLADYDEDKDAMFFCDDADFEVMINPGSFAILFPEDAHYPQPPYENIKKAILKVMI